MNSTMAYQMISRLFTADFSTRNLTPQYFMVEAPISLELFFKVFIFIGVMHAFWSIITSIFKFSWFFIKYLYARVKTTIYFILAIATLIVIYDCFLYVSGKDNLEFQKWVMDSIHSLKLRSLGFDITPTQDTFNQTPSLWFDWGKKLVRKIDVFNKN